MNPMRIVARPMLGAMFILGGVDAFRQPEPRARIAALALAASLVPTTLGGHRFWELDDPAQRRQQRTHFLKNAAMLGGLLLAATE